MRRMSTAPASKDATGSDSATWGWRRDFHSRCSV